MAARAQENRLIGHMQASPGTGFAVFHADESAAVKTSTEVRFDELVFARQLIRSAVLVDPLPSVDRITPLLAAARALATSFSEIWLETADTNEAKALSSFTRKLAVPLRHAAAKAGMISADRAAPRLHLFFLSSAAAYAGMTSMGNASPWPMGIPRLKLPRAAPSRATLKLEEAFMTFLAHDEGALRPGMTAVDLGAAPGGWTWQLVRRHLRVTAVDNGALQPAVLESGLVEHRREDAFGYRPRKPVDWMVCDVVEQPARIARLVATWVAEGWCRRCIFNLKLPMNKRRDEVLRCQDLIIAKLSTARCGHALRLRQLYHDRAEVTGYLTPQSDQTAPRPCANPPRGAGRNSRG